MDILITLAMILAGLWLADLGTGTVHWFVDNYCDPDWPVVGAGYIVYSHGHHEKPLELFQIGIWNRHGYIWMIVAAVGGLIWLAGLLNPLTLSALIFGALTNVIHGWSHYDAERNGRFLTALHKTGLLQSPAHHVHHHSGKNASHYCLLTDHVNPVIEATGLWPHLESLLAKLGIERLWWEKIEAKTSKHPV